MTFGRTCSCAGNRHRNCLLHKACASCYESANGAPKPLSILRFRSPPVPLAYVEEGTGAPPEPSQGSSAFRGCLGELPTSDAAAMLELKTGKTAEGRRRFAVVHIASFRFPVASLAESKRPVVFMHQKLAISSALGLRQDC